MIDLPNTEALRCALDQPLGPILKTLLGDRLADTLECGLQDLTHVLVVQADDDERSIVNAVGFSPLRSRIENQPNSPDWDWLERHDGWWEALYCIGVSGFAYILLIEDADRSPFAKLCRKGKSA